MSSTTGTTPRPPLTPTDPTDTGTTTPTTTPTSTTPTPTSTTPTQTTPTNTTPTNTSPTNTNKPTPTPPTDPGTPSDTGGQQQSTIFSTTFITTDAGGQTVTTVSMGVTSIPDPNTGATNVAVGPIVGGVIGGVGGILLLGFVAWLVFFRSKRPDKYEDGMFDPDKNIQRPGRGGTGGGPGGAFDLGADEIGAARVTPFVLGAGAAGAGAGAGAAAARYSQQPQHHQQYPDMRSYTASDGASDFLPNPYGSAPPSAYGGMAGANLRRGPTTSSNSSGGYPPSLGNGQGTHTDEAYLMSPTTTFSSPSSGQAHAPLPAGASGGGPSAIPGVSAARAAKEREAFSNTRHAQAIANTNAAAGVNPNRFSQGPLVLSNPSLPSPEGEVPPPGVVVHRDGGRVREPEPVDEAEIPPTYDSIPSDSR